MGLDMYLYKSKKVEGFTADEYNKIADYVSENINSPVEIANHDLEKATGVVGANQLKEAIVKCGEHFTWYSIFKDIGYWRKANQIHNWFVEHVQNGVDECQLSIVSKEQLENLLEAANHVLKHQEKADDVLPTRGGFFFGATDYDEYYVAQVKETIRIITKVLQKTDFEKEIIFYRSSW